MAEEAKSVADAKKSKRRRGARTAQVEISFPSDAAARWHEAARALQNQLLDMERGKPEVVSRLYRMFQGLVRCRGIDRTVFAHLLLCCRQNIIEIEYSEGAGFHGITRFTINDLAAFDAGAGAPFTVHSIQWARVSGREQFENATRMNWADIGMAESVDAATNRYVYTFSNELVEKHTGESQIADDEKVKNEGRSTFGGESIEMLERSAGPRRQTYKDLLLDRPVFVYMKGRTKMVTTKIAKPDQAQKLAKTAKARLPFPVFSELRQPPPPDDQVHFLGTSASSPLAMLADVAAAAEHELLHPTKKQKK